MSSAYNFGLPNTGYRSPAPYDDILKLLILGDSGVGKSCLLMRYCDDSFTPSFISTIGIDFKIKTIVISGRRIKLQIWDTAGQERFRTITNYIRTWVSNIEQYTDSRVCKVLVGNKCDDVEGRTISYEKGLGLARELGIPFSETSAKTNVGIDETFLKLATNVKKKWLDVLVDSKPTESPKPRFRFPGAKKKTDIDISPPSSTSKEERSQPNKCC